jgi:iron complex transport system substrate-binding protein
MKKRLLLLVLYTVLFLLFFSTYTNHHVISTAQYHNAYPIQLTDATETPFDLTTIPTRIVSLSPYITESLYLLGVDASLIGVTTFCTHPPYATQKQSVGTMREPNSEAIVTLNPDLVIASKEDQFPSTVATLKQLNIPVFVFDEVNDYRDITTHLQLLGILMDQQDRARTIISSAHDRLRAVSTSHVSRPTVFCTIATEPLITAAPESFIHDIIERAGAINIVPETYKRYPQYNIEDVITQDPDIILHISMNATDSSAQPFWSQYPTLTAVKRNSVITIPADDICRASITSYVRAVEKLSSLFSQR